MLYQPRDIILCGQKIQNKHDYTSMKQFICQPPASSRFQDHSAK